MNRKQYFTRAKAIRDENAEIRRQLKALNYKITRLKQKQNELAKEYQELFLEALILGTFNNEENLK